VTDTLIDTHKAEAAARINVEADRIKIVQLQLNVLRNQGILVDLSVSGSGIDEPAGCCDSGRAESAGCLECNQITIY